MEIIVVVTGTTDTEKLRAEITALLPGETVRFATEREGQYILSGACGGLSGVFKRYPEDLHILASQLKVFSQEIKDFEPFEFCRPLKPYQQRGFFTQPGSRQDKYSRKR